MTDGAKPVDVLIVTGMSGAGRSTAAHALEDVGWYVVDNLPPQMLDPLLELSGYAASDRPRIAAVVDARGRDLSAESSDVIHSIRESGRARVLFLDASDEVLVTRFDAVRRPHPLQEDGTVIDGIRKEREWLRKTREAADVVVDTSRTNVHQLSARIIELFADADEARHTATLMSFGFKYGLPPDADMVVDMRFLPNPFWVPELRPLTGQDETVKDYVLAQPGATPFIDAYARALIPVFEGYQRENKRHSLIAVGCTGGKHRSVVTVQELAARLTTLPGINVRVTHRDLGRE